MKRGTYVNIVLFALFLAFFTSAVLIQRRGLERVLRNPPFVDKIMLSSRSGDMLKLMSLRYDMVTADFLWLRAIQSFGGRGMTNRDWKPIYNLFDTITELDPYFEQAYTFGNMVIGDEGGRQEEGLELLRKGMFNLLRQYRIPFEGMYVAHWSMKDADMARWFGRMTVKRKDMPDWVPRVVAYIEVQAGEYYIGYQRFVANLLQAVDAGDETLQGIALNKVRETIESWNSMYLLQAYDEYTSATGAPPKRIEDLASMPALRNLELPRMSDLVAYVERYADALGKQGIDEYHHGEIAMPSAGQLAAVEVLTTATQGTRNLLDLENVIFEATLRTASGIPEDPYGAGYELNRMQIGYHWADRDSLIMSRGKIEESLREAVENVRKAIAERTTELGRYPRDLREVFHTDFNTTEPLGGSFRYNPQTGDFTSTSLPDF